MRIADDFVWALKRAARQPKYLAASTMSGILFIMLYSFFNSAVYSKMLEYMVALSSLTAAKSAEFGAILGKSPTLMQAIVSVEGAKPFAIDIVILVIISMIGLFVFYSLFEGLSWYYSAKIAGRSIDYPVFMKRFFKVNIVWIITYAIIKGMGLLAGFNDFTADRPYSSGIGGMGIIIYALYAIMVFCMIISYLYIMGQKGKGMLHQAKNLSKRCILPFIISIAVIAGVHFLQLGMFKLNIALGGVVAIAVELPMITAIKAYMIRSSREA